MFPAISVSRLKISRRKQNNVIQWRREGCSASLCSNYSQNLNLMEGLSVNTGVYLLPMTAEMYHEYFKEYQNDLDLYIDKSTYQTYTYEEEKVNRYIQRQIDLKRKVFAIMFNGEMVGEIVIKNIVEREKKKEVPL